jgi:hypothetical protein
MQGLSHQLYNNTLIQKFQLLNLGMTTEAIPLPANPIINFPIAIKTMFSMVA